MSTRERILMIRLLEKVRARPAYAGMLGIEVGKERLYPWHRPDSEPAGKSRNAI